MMQVSNIIKQIPFYTTLFLFSVLPFAYAAESLISPDFSLTPITRKIHVIYGPMSQPNKQNRGFRNNPVIIQTSKGVVVLDPGGSAYVGEMVAKKVKNVMNSPIVAVFNSHAHGDHWLGNEGIKRVYPQAVIYGHPKMIKRVAGNDGVFWLDLINKVTSNTSLGKIVVKPDKAVNHANIIKTGDTRFRIYHIGPAHTDNDIMIEIIEEKAIFMGDVVRNGLFGIMQA